MSKLPTVSAKELVSVLEDFNYKIVRQKGSHVRMKSSDRHRKPVTVPNHKEIGRGIVRKILRNADISPEKFKKLV